MNNEHATVKRVSVTCVYSVEHTWFQHKH